MATSDFPPVPRSHSLDPARLEAYALPWGKPPATKQKPRPFERAAAVKIAFDAPWIEHEGFALYKDPRKRDLSVLPLDLEKNERMCEDEALFWLTLLKEPRYCFKRQGVLEPTLEDLDALTNATSIERRINHRAEEITDPTRLIYVATQLYPDIPDLLDYLNFEREVLGQNGRIHARHFLTMLELVQFVPPEHRERIATFYDERVDSPHDLSIRARIAWHLPFQDKVREVLAATERLNKRPTHPHHIMLSFKLEDLDEALEGFVGMKKNLQSMNEPVHAFFGKFGYEHVDTLFKSIVFASSKGQEERLRDALQIRSREVAIEAVQRYESRAARNLFHKYLVEDADETSLRTLLELCDRRGKLQIRAITLLREAISFDLTRASFIRSILSEYPQKVQDLIAPDLETDDVPPLLPFRWSAWHREVASLEVPGRDETLLDFDALPELLTADKQFGYIRALQKGICALGTLAFSRAPSIDATLRARALALLELDVLSSEIDLASLQNFLLELMNTTGFARHFQDARAGYHLLGHICDRRAIPDLITMTQHPKRGDDERTFAIDALMATESGEALRHVQKLETDAYAEEVREHARRAIMTYRKNHGLDQQSFHLRAIPDHGFDKRGTRRFDYGERTIELRMQSLEELVITDLSSGQTYVHPPAPLATDNLEKATASRRDLKNVIDAFELTSQKLSGLFEEMMVRGFHHDLERWREHYHGHTLLDLVSRRLLWLIEDQTTGERRVVLPTEDQTFMQPDYELWEPASDHTYRIHLAHPCELGVPEANQWGALLGEFEICQPMPQLDRNVFSPTEEHLAKLDALVGKPFFAAKLIAQLDHGWMLQCSEDPRRIDRLTLAHQTRGHISLDFSGGTFRTSVGRPAVPEEMTWAFSSLTIDVLENPANQGVQSQQRSHPDRNDPFHVLMDMERVDDLLFSEALATLLRCAA